MLQMNTIIYLFENHAEVKLDGSFPQIRRVKISPRFFERYMLLARPQCASNFQIQVVCKALPLSGIIIQAVYSTGYCFVAGLFHRLMIVQHFTRAKLWAKGKLATSCCSGAFYWDPQTFKPHLVNLKFLKLLKKSCTNSWQLGNLSGPLPI